MHELHEIIEEYKGATNMYIEELPQRAKGLSPEVIEKKKVAAEKSLEKFKERCHEMLNNAGMVSVNDSTKIP